MSFYSQLGPNASFFSLFFLLLQMKQTVSDCGFKSAVIYLF